MGRLQTFNEDEVIQKAQDLFWEKGYVGTSLSDILEATGLHKGSLYRTFESKEKLFLLALQRYGGMSRSKFIKNQEPLSYLKSFFERLVNEGSKSSKGCFIMNSCVELGVDKSLLGKVAKSLLEDVTNNFKEALTIAQAEGSIDGEVDIKELSARFVGAAFSIREMSKFSSDQEAFRAIANGVLKEINMKI